MVKIWNFQKQKVEKAKNVPGCNGVSGGDFCPVYISHKESGTKIIDTKEKDDELV